MINPNIRGLRSTTSLTAREGELALMLDTAVPSAPPLAERLAP